MWFGIAHFAEFVNSVYIDCTFRIDSIKVLFLLYFSFRYSKYSTFFVGLPFIWFSVDIYLEENVRLWCAWAIFILCFSFILSENYRCSPYHHIQKHTHTDIMLLSAFCTCAWSLFTSATNMNIKSTSLYAMCTARQWNKLTNNDIHHIYTYIFIYAHFLSYSLLLLVFACLLVYPFYGTKVKHDRKKKKRSTNFQ